MSSSSRCRLGDTERRRTRMVETLRVGSFNLISKAVRKPLYAVLFINKNFDCTFFLYHYHHGFQYYPQHHQQICPLSALFCEHRSFWQELLDLIIAHLGDDTVTLLSCALVHPAWTSISRYHLSPVTLIVPSPSRSKELVKLLRSSRETLSSSITGITLVGDIPFDDSAMNG